MRAPSLPKCNKTVTFSKIRIFRLPGLTPFAELPPSPTHDPPHDTLSLSLSLSLRIAADCLPGS